MIGNVFERKVESLLAQADVRVGGDRPWDIRVHNRRFFRRVMVQGALGLGESYMEGWWDCERLDEFFHRTLSRRLDEKVPSLAAAADRVRARVVNLQSRRRAFKVGQHHYDIGNDLFERMLDHRMIYSCAYWDGASDLDEAQERKLDLACRKLGLEPGMRLLDVGCGWGGTARFAAERYGVEVTGITISGEQAAMARHLCRGLPVRIRLMDYRDLEGTFDRIVSIGMFEHVGPRNYRTYMEKMAGLLEDGGLFLLQTIGANRASNTVNPWTARYIFPNGALPSPGRIAEAVEGLLVLEDWQNFGPDYDRTLMHWYRNFEEEWSSLRDRYDERFRRMWTFFLLSSAGDFRARRDQLWQLVLSRGGVPGGYKVVR